MGHANAKYLKLDSNTIIHYRDSSNTEKPVVLLVHGLGASSRYLVPLASRLQENYRVVIPDFPDHGKSSSTTEKLLISDFAAVNHQFQEQLHVKPLALIGNSMGCQIIAAQLAEYPGDAQAAILLGPTVNRHERTLPKQIVRLLQDSRKEPSSSVKILGKDYKDAGVRRVAKDLRATLDDAIEENIAKVTTPILIVRGTHDPIVPKYWAKELVKAAPNAKLAEIEGPHPLNYSSPDETYATINDFLIAAIRLY